MSKLAVWVAVLGHGVDLGSMCYTATEIFVRNAPSACFHGCVTAEVVFSKTMAQLPWYANTLA